MRSLIKGESAVQACAAMMSELFEKISDAVTPMLAKTGSNLSDPEVGSFPNMQPSAL